MIGVRVTFALSESSSQRGSKFVAAWHGRGWIEAQSGGGDGTTRQVEKKQVEKDSAVTLTRP
jgi:hypothetical protein